MRSIMSVWSCALIACFSSYLQEAEAQRAPVGVSVSPARQEVSSAACFCYKEKIKGAYRPVTACRSTPKACERLREKVQRGTKLLLKNSASTPCTSVLMSKHPSEVLGDHAGWAPSRKVGSFFYPQG